MKNFFESNITTHLTQKSLIRTISRKCLKSVEVGFIQFCSFTNFNTALKKLNSQKYIVFEAQKGQSYFVLVPFHLILEKNRSCPSFPGRHNTLHNDNKHNNIQHNDTQHNDTQNKELICDTQHK